MFKLKNLFNWFKRKEKFYIVLGGFEKGAVGTLSQHRPFSAARASEFVKDLIIPGSKIKAFVLRKDGSVMWEVYWSETENQLHWKRPSDPKKPNL